MESDLCFMKLIFVEMFRLNVYTIGYVLDLIIIGIFNSIQFCLYVDHIKITL